MAKKELDIISEHDHGGSVCLQRSMFLFSVKTIGQEEICFRVNLCTVFELNAWLAASDLLPFHISIENANPTMRCPWQPAAAICAFMHVDHASQQFHSWKIQNIDYLNPGQIVRV